MSDGQSSPVVLANGVSRNPLSSKDDDPYMEVVHALLDLVCCIRGEVPNRNLGNADHFIGVGEWGMAMDSIESALKDEFPLKNPWIAAAFERADNAIPKNAEGYRD